MQGNAHLFFHVFCRLAVYNLIVDYKRDKEGKLIVMANDFQEMKNEKEKAKLQEQMDKTVYEDNACCAATETGDEAVAAEAASGEEKVKTEVWQMPDREAIIKEDMKHPEKLSSAKAQRYANHFAHEEMNAMETYLTLLEMQARRSFLFEDIDMDMVRQVILEPVKATYFDKRKNVKAQYVDLLINDYAERLEAAELLDSADDDDMDDDE